MTDDDYAPGEDRPLAAYALLSGTFFAGLGAALAAAKARGRPLDRPGLADILVTGLATQKVSRLLTKDKVTSFIRAPFTRFQEPAGHGELEETARGTGARYASGELLVGPSCLARWVAAGFAVGLVAAPRATRFVAGIYAAETLADFLQL